jgi:hypothetical protein
LIVQHRRRTGRRLGLANCIGAPPTAQRFDQQHAGIQDKIVSERFTEGFEQFAALIEGGLGASPIKADKRQRAMAMMAAMMGGVAASRAVAKADPKLPNQILRAVRQIMVEVGGDEGSLGARERARVTTKSAR